MLADLLWAELASPLPSASFSLPLYGAGLPESDLQPGSLLFSSLSLLFFYSLSLLLFSSLSLLLDEV